MPVLRIWEQTCVDVRFLYIRKLSLALISSLNLNITLYISCKYRKYCQYHFVIHVDLIIIIWWIY